MSLHLLPDRTGGAAENMALDFLLLQRYPEEEAARFRHYEWRQPACTFGYSQKVAFVRAHLPAPAVFDLCRRPTGGGIVDHRHDWTYSLVVPRGQALADEPAAQSYRVVHECLAAALAACGQPAELKCASEWVERVDPNVLSGKASVGQAAAPTGICFQRAELYDVVDPRTGAKIAGAAQKRNRRGLLLQGSVEKSSVGNVAWKEFARNFAEGLGRMLGVAPVETPWPDLNDDEVGGLIDQYSAPEWLECR